MAGPPAPHSAARALPRLRRNRLLDRWPAGTKLVASQRGLPAGTKLVASQRAKSGADDQDRTGDLVLTKDVLCQLSYIGLRATLTSLSPRYGRHVGLRLACQP